MAPEPKKLRVLFLCTSNACRSQMAEGFARHLKSDTVEARSAGIVPDEPDPRAVKVMQEVGVDISKHRSKHINEFIGQEFDLIVTVCDDAREQCPFFPGKAKRIHAAFDDPPLLAQNTRTEEEALQHYRRVRDEIREFVEQLPAPADKG